MYHFPENEGTGQILLVLSPFVYASDYPQHGLPNVVGAYFPSKTQVIFTKTYGILTDSAGFWAQV